MHHTKTIFTVTCDLCKAEITNDDLQQRTLRVHTGRHTGMEPITFTLQWRLNIPYANNARDVCGECLKELLTKIQADLEKTSA